MSHNNNDAFDSALSPTGILALQTLTQPRNTNANGDIFGGWLMSQMDLAGAITAKEVAQGPVTTVAVGGMSFLSPIKVGAIVSCYCNVLAVGRSSMRIKIEVWTQHYSNDDKIKVTESEFVFVAIDDQGRTRPLPNQTD